MNHLANLKKIKNTYFVLRHGKSLANEAGIIVTDPKIGTKKYGLAEIGKQQIIDSVTKIKQENVLDQSTLIFSSDFLRCQETAALAQSILKVPLVLTSKSLRERFFGDFEGASLENYQHIWDEDIKSTSHTTFNVESIDMVIERLTSFIAGLENICAHQKILLVSHGDPLQILQTVFENKSSTHHRELTHLETGEIRELQFSIPI